MYIKMAIKLASVLYVYPKTVSFNFNRI